MTLWTIDEAREALVASSTMLVEQASCDANQLCLLLWGAGSIDGLAAGDRVLGMRHRAVLDNIIELGYGSEAVDEIEGVLSAAGLDEAEEDGVDHRRVLWSFSPRPSS
jgi:hypothetical protein